MLPGGSLRSHGPNGHMGACPLASRTMKQASFASSMVQGGGKRRVEGMERF